MIWNSYVEVLEEDSWLIKLTIESKKQMSIDYGELDFKPILENYIFLLIPQKWNP